MAYDVAIRNGTVLDGTGAPSVRADVGIEGDRIVEVGQLDGSAKQEIDAEGKLVTPGFVDIHTHLDAQFGWDPLGTSSCYHGVTSVVMGNCGVTFAPCKPSDREFLAEMMESVEDIPRDTILSGLPWDWESFGEYLDSLERLPLGLNVGGMVGHAAVRVAAMGERSLDQEPASEEDVHKICALVEESLQGGALGFSTTRTFLHVVPDGRAVPGTYADRNELLAIADVLARSGKGTLEGAMKIGEGKTTDSDREEVQLMAEMSRRSGRPFTFGLTQSARRPGMMPAILDETEIANRTGANLRPQSSCRSINIMFGIAGLSPFFTAKLKPESWRGWSKLSLEERLARLDDPEIREAMIAEAEAVSESIEFDQFFLLGDKDPRYDNDPQYSLASLAKAQGKSPARSYVETLHDSRGRSSFYYPFLNQDLDAVADFVRNPVCAMGLGDSGAHVGQIIDAGQATWLLKHWVRERGLISVEQAVHQLTADTADLFGLTDRGRIKGGAFADLNVIDLEAIGFPTPTYVEDFPGNAGRWIQTGRGYDYTLVNGRVLMDHGEHTGETPGGILRG